MANAGFFWEACEGHQAMLDLQQGRRGTRWITTTCGGGGKNSNFKKGEVCKEAQRTQLCYPWHIPISWKQALSTKVAVPWVAWAWNQLTRLPMFRGEEDTQGSNQTDWHFGFGVIGQSTTTRIPIHHLTRESIILISLSDLPKVPYYRTCKMEGVPCPLMIQTWGDACLCWDRRSPSMCENNVV